MPPVDALAMFERFLPPDPRVRRRGAGPRPAGADVAMPTGVTQGVLGCGVLLALALGVAWPACAADDPAVITPSVRYSAEFQPCMDRAGGSTMPMLDCLRAETALWDQRLNIAYRAAMARRDVSEATRALLRDAQRAWITYRDKGCAAAGNLEAEGGSLALVVSADCVLRLTARRALELE